MDDAPQWDPRPGAALDAGSAVCYTSGVIGPARVSAGGFGVNYALTFAKAVTVAQMKLNKTATAEC